MQAEGRRNQCCFRFQEIGTATVRKGDYYMLKSVKSSHEHICDTGLAQKISEGNQESVEYLISQYSEKMLVTACKITNNDADAEDCVQEAFIKILTCIHQFSGRSSLATWVKRIVTNVALMHLRSQSRKKEEPIDALLPTFDRNYYRVNTIAICPEARLVEDLVFQREINRCIQTALNRLPLEFRSVVIARDVFGFDTVEASSLLDISASLVRTRLHRARAALKVFLAPFYHADAH